MAFSSMETIPIVYLSPYRIHEGGNCGFTDYYILLYICTFVNWQYTVSILEYPLNCIVHCTLYLVLSMCLACAGTLGWVYGCIFWLRELNYC